MAIGGETREKIRLVQLVGRECFEFWQRKVVWHGIEVPNDLLDEPLPCGIFINLSHSR